MAGHKRSNSRYHFDSGDEHETNPMFVQTDQQISQRKRAKKDRSIVLVQSPKPPNTPNMNDPPKHQKTISGRASEPTQIHKAFETPAPAPQPRLKPKSSILPGKNGAKTHIRFLSSDSEPDSKSPTLPLKPSNSKRNEKKVPSDKPLITLAPLLSDPYQLLERQQSELGIETETEESQRWPKASSSPEDFLRRDGLMRQLNYVFGGLEEEDQDGEESEKFIGADSTPTPTARRIRTFGSTSGSSLPGPRFTETSNIENDNESEDDDGISASDVSEKEMPIQLSSSPLKRKAICSDPSRLTKRTKSETLSTTASDDLDVASSHVAQASTLLLEASETHTLMSDRQRHFYLLPSDEQDGTLPEDELVKRFLGGFYPPLEVRDPRARIGNAEDGNLVSDAKTRTVYEQGSDEAEKLYHVAQDLMPTKIFPNLATGSMQQKKQDDVDITQQWKETTALMTVAIVNLRSTIDVWTKALEVGWRGTQLPENRKRSSSTRKEDRRAKKELRARDKQKLKIAKRELQRKQEERDLVEKRFAQMNERGLWGTGSVFAREIKKTTISGSGSKAGKRADEVVSL